MIGTMSMSEHVKEFYSISEKLSEIQVEISEDLLAIILLCSEEYLEPFECLLSADDLKIFSFINSKYVRSR